MLENESNFVFKWRTSSSYHLNIYSYYFFFACYCNLFSFVSYFVLRYLQSIHIRSDNHLV